MTPLDKLARWHYRRRFWVAGSVLLATALVLPAALDLRIDNGTGVWFKRDDPNWVVYREHRKEFGGSRNVIVALKAKDLFTRENLRYLDKLTRELERLPYVLTVYSLATANRVIATEDTLDVRSYLDGLDSRDLEEIRAEVSEDEGVVGDLVSRDGTVASITVSFDEDGSDPIREALLADVRRLAEAGRPPEVETFFNGNLVVSESYDRASRRNLVLYTPLTLVLLVAASYFLFRSWARVGLIVTTTALAVGCTLALFSIFDFPFNIVSTVVVPLVGILCIADDMHILQHFDRVLSQTGDRERAFRETIVSQLPPILGATATTSLGMLSLATSQVAAVREFGMAAAAGVAVDLAITFAVIPLGLTLSPPRSGAAPSGARITGAMIALSRLTAHRTRLVLGLAAIAVVWSLLGIARLRASTNHVEFFPEGSELPASARIMDESLSGIHSFEVVLESAEEAFNDPALLRRIDAFVGAVESMENVSRAVSFLESLKKVHAELYPGSPGALPETRAAVVQELFLFGLSDRGRDALRSFLSTDYQRMRIWVKLPAVSSEQSTAQILEVERLARRAFEGSSPRIKVIVTGPGKMFSALDVYLVESQLRSFATAFVTVFGVIFLLFRSVRYGLVSIPTNLVPVLIVLGVMGWLGITLNVATVVVASIALGVIDDDTVHFLMTYRREREGGAGSEGAIRTSIREVGGAALLAAVINCLTFGITAISDYKPAAYWGWLMALVVILAFLSEVLLLPACLRAGARFFQPRTNENSGWPLVP